MTNPIKYDFEAKSTEKQLTAIIKIDDFINQEVLKEQVEQGKKFNRSFENTNPTKFKCFNCGFEPKGFIITSGKHYCKMSCVLP